MHITFMYYQLAVGTLVMVVGALAGVSFRALDETAHATARWCRRRRRRNQQTLMVETTLPANVADAMADVLRTTKSWRQQLLGRDASEDRLTPV